MLGDVDLVGYEARFSSSVVRLPGIIAAQVLLWNRFCGPLLARDGNK